MRPRKPPIPQRWLMTDERMGEALWTAIARLPRGSGIVFRHYATPARERAEMWRAIGKIAQRRGLIAVRAGEPIHPEGAGVHKQRRARRLQIVTAPAHSRREALAAVRSGADALFVSPVFATRSHPGARPLGPVRLGLMIRQIGVPVIALGGMTRARARRLAQFGIHGWAAIDAWTGEA